MFTPEEFSLKIFKDRYAFTPEETWKEACRRVANQMSIAEQPNKQRIYSEKFYDILVNNLFVPGGRIWYNSGRNNPQLLNCFVLSNELDSKEGWGNISKEMIITSMTGGGCGIDFSDVRPRGALISGQKGECPGPVSLMELIDFNAKPVRAGGQRRVALMFSLDLDHPDIEEFLDAKLEKGKLTHANISVRSKRTNEFIKAVKKDLDWELSWKGKYKKIIKAKVLWDKIVKNAYETAEPGFLNWELTLNESNIGYIEDLVTTNPCVVGNTLIAVADGRNAISIEQLVSEGKDIPVYSTNLKTGQIEIKYGRNPRKTGSNCEVWKLTLDNGSVLKATPDHKILTKSLIYKELKNLELGESIFPFYTFDSNEHIEVFGIGNLKVASVEFHGYEDVYNITVDDNYNYNIITLNDNNRNSGLCVKNCGEIALSSYDCCCLGHLVLTRFIDGNDINYSLLGDTIRMAIRFLDNVLSVNSYPLPEMKAKSQSLRRIGLGTTALADTLAILGFKYGSEEGNKFIDKLYRFISKAAYEASIMLAVEKGAFPDCNPEKHIQSDFMKRMPAKIRSLVQEHGIRNCCILTQAPTGTVSILSGNCSSGIEPMFAPAYERRYWDGDERKVELVFHPLFSKFMKENKNVNHFVGSHDLLVKDHLEVQKIIQRHVDNAVSKSVNIPYNYPIDDMEKLWLDYLPYLKGTTFYRENTRGFFNEKTGQLEEPPLKALSLEEAKDRFNKEIGVEKNEIDCSSGLCEF